jgi:hypothetical protein
MGVLADMAPGRHLLDAALEGIHRGIAVARDVDLHEAVGGNGLPIALRLASLHGEGLRGRLVGHEATLPGHALEACNERPEVSVRIRRFETTI